MSNPEPGLGPLVEPGPELTVSERARYARHLLLDQIGELGQRRLRAARVLVIGAGGLGSPALQYLAGAGIGRLTVVDDDDVDLGNLQRQVIHRESTIGTPKVESARQRLAELSSAVEVRSVCARVDADTIGGLLEGHHLVLDGSDNFHTRYLVSDACEIAGIPLVWGTLDRFRGQVSVFWSAPPAPTPPVTLRDLYPSPPPAGSVPTCAEAGVVGALCGIVGSMMAAEAVKLVTGAGRSLLGRLLLVDAADMSTRSVAVHPDPHREPVTELTDPDPLVCGTEPGAPGGGEGSVTAVPTVSPTELDAELRSPRPPVLVDVRGAGERAIARIEPSVWLPLEAVAEDAADPTGVLRRAVSPGTELVVYCKAGVRSARAAGWIRDAGLTRVRSLDGGIDAWTRQIDPTLPGY